MNKLRSSLLSLLHREKGEESTFLFLTILTGILAGLVTVSLDFLIHNIIDFVGTNKPFDLKAFILGGLLIGISGWISTRLYKSTSGSGIPGIKIHLVVHHGRISFRETIAKFVTTVLSLSSGISLGKEGPVVTICSGIGSKVGQYFHLSKKRMKALVAVGSASGIAGAFNTPISAVVFTLEEVVGDLNTKYLSSIIIGSVVAAVTGHVLLGERSIFTQVHYRLNNPSELIFYLIIGVVAAVMGPVWMKTTLQLRKLSVKVFKNHKLTLILVAFLIIGGLSHIQPRILGGGHMALEEALTSSMLNWKVIGVLFLLKFIATSISYSSGASGGLFMPTLLVGAALGSFIGALSYSLFPDLANSNIGAYALVGMGAYFVTVIRAPMTSILMVFELTRDYNIILPLMIANITAYLLSSKLSNLSIYEHISEQDGIHLPTREDEEILESVTVEDAYIKDVITFNHSDTIKDAYRILKTTNVSGFPIIKGNQLYGVIAKSDIMAHMIKKNHNLKLADVCEKKIIKVYPDQSLMVAFHRLKRFQISRLPVVSRLNDKQLIGIITAQEIVKHFGHRLQEEKNKISLEDKEYEASILSEDQKVFEHQ